jgi:hypothetical protein
MAAVCFDRSPAVVFKRFPSFFDIFGAHSSNERWIFLVTYFCITLGILIGTLQATLLANHPERVKRLNGIAGLGLPVLFFALIALCMIS